VHIRDCKGNFQTPASDADGQQFDTVVTGHRAPGKPEMQANGRGDIDLVGYIAVLHQNDYTGPLNLEVIGAKEYSLEQCCTIAAESRGHMQACLQTCGAR
jgi:sugar phosphate isomerase/epimerase